MLKRKAASNGQSIAIGKVPVMYRLPGISGQPMNSRYPARATAIEAALKKGYPAGEVCSRYGGKTRRPHFFGRPVAVAGHRIAAPLGAAFCAF